MLIGDILKNRMSALGVSVSELAEETFLEEEYINSILVNEVSIVEINPIDLEFIATILYCTPEYFYNESIQKKDIIHSCLNRGNSDIKSNIVKGKLQQFANDFIFLKNIISEVTD